MWFKQHSARTWSSARLGKSTEEEEELYLSVDHKIE